MTGDKGVASVLSDRLSAMVDTFFDSLPTGGTKETHFQIIRTLPIFYHLKDERTACDAVGQRVVPASRTQCPSRTQEAQQLDGGNDGSSSWTTGASGTVDTCYSLLLLG